MDAEIRLVKKALAGNEDALLGFKHLLGEFEQVASDLYWKTHCTEFEEGGRCNALVGSRACNRGHVVAAR